MAEVEQNYKRTIRKVTYRGLDLDRVLRAADADVRRAAAWPLTRCLRRKRDWPLKWLREAKKHVLPLERREVVTTHPRELIILPRTPDSMMGVYSRETFSLVGIKPERTGRYLGELSIPYKPAKHGGPGVRPHPPPDPSPSSSLLASGGRDF